MVWLLTRARAARVRVRDYYPELAEYKALKLAELEEWRFRKLNSLVNALELKVVQSEKVMEWFEHCQQYMASGDLRTLAAIEDTLSSRIALGDNSYSRESAYQRCRWMATVYAVARRKRNPKPSGEITTHRRRARVFVAPVPMNSDPLSETRPTLR